MFLGGTRDHINLGHLRCKIVALVLASGVTLLLSHPDRDIPKGGTVYTWWLIPLSKWVITPIISGLTLLIPFITGVITHLLSGMSHQVQIIEHMEAS